MNDFWKSILTSVLNLAMKIVEKLLDSDINGDGKVGL